MRAAVVVGAGVAGSFAARVLSQSGWRVTLLDAGLAGAATPASAGILMRVGEQGGRDWEELAWAGHVAWPGLCAELGDTGFERRGLLACGENADTLARWAQQRGLSHEWYEPDRVRARWPQLAPSRMLYLPDIAQLDPRALLNALHHSLEQAGVVRERAEVEEVRCAKERVVAVRQATREWAADAVILAAGAWSGALAPDAQACADLLPRRGEILCWRGVDTGDLPILLDGARYLVPRACGEVLAGATDEDAGFDVAPGEAARTMLTDFARSWCPELLAGEPAEQRIGLRPASADGLPRTLRHPAIGGLYCHTGHYRHGIVCAPGAAARLAALVGERAGEAVPV